VVKGKHIYWVNDRGLATCAETATGKVLYQERIGLGGGESASRPVYGSTVLAGDNLYSVTRQGGVFVWKASETFTKIGLNKIEGDETDFNPSLAISDNKLFLRSNKAIYCVGAK
jgi:outer membrane protein assembly factor BamB